MCSLYPKLKKENLVLIVFLEKAMATTPVPWPGKSRGWRSLVGCSPWGHEDSDTTKQLQFHFSLFTFTHWRRKWQPTPVFLPGESQGWWGLVGCHLWGRTELDTTERLHFSLSLLRKKVKSSKSLDSSII